MTNKPKKALASAPMATSEFSYTPKNAHNPAFPTAAINSLIRYKMQKHLLSFASALLATVVLCPLISIAQSTSAAPEKAAPATQAQPSQTTPAMGSEGDRATAYYHLALAHTYAEMATNQGHPEYATRAIEEYKLALNADPNSTYLNNGLAELYYKTGKIKEAVVAAQDLVKKDPNDLNAHKLLGRIYLRSLGEGQQNAAAEKVLELAIGEYEKIVQLSPKDIQSRLLLGRLYSVNHETPKAEAQFKAAQAQDPDSEEVVLNLARLYSDLGDIKRAASVIEAVPESDRSPQMEYILGATYDQQKDTKKAIDAYRRSLDAEPENFEVERALAQDLLNDNQLDEALKAYREIVSGDPQDAQSLLRISEIERRQGHYEAALNELKKAKSILPESLEVGYNEALLQDALGHYDDSTHLLEKLVASQEHANGAYSDQEKNNLAIFLQRLAIVYHEQNMTKQAIDAYGRMIELGGEYQLRGYQGQVDVYRDAHRYKEALATAQTAVQNLPKERSLKLMLASQMVDVNKPDEGIQPAKGLRKGTSDDREVYMTMAQMNTRLRRWKDAEDNLAKAEPLSDKQEDKLYVSFLRATLAERQKHFEQAEQIFRQILSTDPDNMMALNYLGYMLADRGVKLEEALKFVRKAVELDPQNGAYLDSLGWVYFKMGQYALAEENLRKAIERLSTDPTVHDHLGQLYEKTGRLKLAAAQWEIAVTQFSQTTAGDTEPGEMSKVQKKLETARIRLAKQEAQNPPKAEIEP
jgi:tetratricopeptide (TPR) repeat protein